VGGWVGGRLGALGWDGEDFQRRWQSAAGWFPGFASGMAVETDRGRARVVECFASGGEMKRDDRRRGGGGEREGKLTRREGGDGANLREGEKGFDDL
jgi:hypothetical protein